MTRKPHARAAAIAVLAILNPACAVPFLATTGGEREMGRNAAQQVEEQIGIVQDTALVEYVGAVGRRLIEHSRLRDLEYTFYVVDMKETNAFALPGGHIYVSRGLLALLNSEDELANVVAHEIGHVSARHHLKQSVRKVPFLPARIATGLGGWAVGIVSPTLGRAVSAIGRLPGALVLSPYSRGQENEADELGQQIAAAAGYDPAALSSVMNALGREEALEGHDPERRSFFASHPSSPERTERTAERATRLTVATARPIAADASAFLQRLDGLLVGTSAAEGVFVGDRFLHPDLEFKITFPEGWETHNGAEAVAGVSPDHKSMVLVSLVGKGASPLSIARTLYEEGSLDLDAAPEPMRIGGLPAARALGRSGDARLLIHWVAHGGLIYQITGVSPNATFAEHRPRLGRCAESFGSLESGDRAEIRESHLRIVKARAGDTLEALVERRASSWSPERAAVANALQSDQSLAAATPIKLAIPEVYTPSGHAP